MMTDDDKLEAVAAVAHTFYIHNRNAYAAYYEVVKDQVGGFPGIWPEICMLAKIINQASDILESKGTLFEDNHMEAVEKLSGHYLKQSIESGKPFNSQTNRTHLAGMAITILSNNGS